MTPDYRARIARFNPRLNAYVDLTDEPAEAGLAFAVKSNIAVRGLPLTAGIGAYRQRIADRDAVCVERIRAAGGTILGSVNMHEGALGATTANVAYGITHNPWAEGFTTGGSSGGSGAAVAAGLCDVALGTDTMGSIRIPAAYCGCQGFKPSYALIPDAGVVPLSPTLDHVGPLARDVNTLWRAMRLLADWPADEPLVTLKLNGLRAGVWQGDDAVTLTAAVKGAFSSALEKVSFLRTVCAPFVPPVYDYARSRRAGLLISEIEGFEEHSVAIGETPEGFTDQFRTLLLWGRAQSAEKVQAAYDHVAAVREAAEAVWRDHDFILAPVAPQTAFALDEEVPANQADFTAWANFAGLPAAALWAGLSPGGLPCAIQVIGPPGRDKFVLQVAAALEQVLGTPPLPPGYEDYSIGRFLRNDPML